MRKKLLIGFLLAVLAVGMTFSAGMAKDLVMYTALDVDEAKIYINAFEKSHPDINVKWTRLSAGEALARIKAESSNPQASLFFGGSSTAHIGAANAGLLKPYKSTGWQYLSSEYKDPKGRWTGFYTGYIGFVTNTEFLDEHNVEAPDSWQDLLKPVFKNEIIKAYPYTSGTAYTTLISQLQAMGPKDEGWDEKDRDYIGKLNKQIHHYTRSGSACVTLVGQGEGAVGIAFSHDILAKGVDKGYPVKLTFPSEGTGFEVGAVSIIKGGPTPETAKTFIDWLMTAEAQSLFKKWFRVPLNPEAELAKGLVTASEVPVIKGFSDSVTWYGEHKSQIVDVWRQITGQ
ncbi:MAG: ABC transporter substrate-binding protein [Candidatus Bipolaricaulia bacterium]